MRALSLASVLALASVAVAFPLAGTAGTSSIAPPGLMFLRGDLHAHTCYSDGALTPADAFAQVKAAGSYDFFAVTEHSEMFEAPFCADEACIPFLLECYTSPLPEATEWEDELAQADAATDAGFVGIRGFEWSHPGDGHINVWGSAGYVGSATHPLPTLYAWLNLPPPAGGSDGVASFNHPGREPMMFEKFAYSARGDAKVAALELYNRGNTYLPQYALALDQGWHVAATGVSDSHTPDKWVEVRGHTVVLAPERTRGAILDAIAAGRTFGTDDPAMEVVFEAAGTLMGGTVDAPAQFPARIVVRDPGPGHGIARVAVLSRGGFEVASLDAGGAASVAWEPVLWHPDDGTETWFVARVQDVAGRSAVTAPVWVR